MAQIKHYVGYDSDNENTFIDDQTLHEVYVAPFDAAVKADVSSIMCSYNRLNGTFACGNKDTLTKILRDEIGFKGFVTSDWGAVHSVDFINAGLDMEMPGEPDPKSGGFSIPSFFDSQARASTPAASRRRKIWPTCLADTFLKSPCPRKKISAELGRQARPKEDACSLERRHGHGSGCDSGRRARALRDCALRVLDGQSKHDVTPQSIEENAKIIEKTGEDAAVLLKNEGSILPLKSSDLDSVVLIGPTGGQVDSIGINGERSVGLPERQVGPLAAMRQISGNADIGFAVDDDMTGSTVPASALSHDGKPGLLRTGSGSEQTDAELNFTSKGANALPANATVTWKGTLTVPQAGNYWIYLQAMGTNASLTLDGKKFAATGAFQGGVHGDILQANQDNVIPTTDGLDNVRRAIDLTAGPHAVEIVTSPDSSSAPVQVRLNWYTPEQRKADHEAAISAAKSAKVAVVFVWTRLQPVFGLPGDQNKLVEEVAAVNPNTVVVLNTSQPVALPWVDKVKARS